MGRPDGRGDRRAYEKLSPRRFLSGSDPAGLQREQGTEFPERYEKTHPENAACVSGYSLRRRGVPRTGGRDRADGANSRARQRDGGSRYGRSAGVAPHSSGIGLPVRRLHAFRGTPPHPTPLRSVVRPAGGGLRPARGGPRIVPLRPIAADARTRRPEDVVEGKIAAAGGMSVENVTAAVIGTGFIGPVHIEALRRIGGVEIVAVGSRDLRKAKSIADTYSI